MTDRERWEQLRRTLLNIVAQMRRADPQSRYTLDVQIVPKEQAQKVA